MAKLLDIRDGGRLMYDPEFRSPQEADALFGHVMGAASQHHWLHAVPKSDEPVGERISLTFRFIVGAAG